MYSEHESLPEVKNEVSVPSDNFVFYPEKWQEFEFDYDDLHWFTLEQAQCVSRNQAHGCS